MTNELKTLCATLGASIEAVRLLNIATERLQEYSENECVIGRTGDTNISELLAFCEVAG